MSNKQYHNHVAVFNIRHMPQGCGYVGAEDSNEVILTPLFPNSTWPAVWEVGANWPHEGEIDILEGANDVSPNQATLHTDSGALFGLRWRMKFIDWMYSRLHDAKQPTDDWVIYSRSNRLLKECHSNTTIVTLQHFNWNKLRCFSDRQRILWCQIVKQDFLWSCI